MQENSRYAVGIDVGTTEVRCVVGHVDQASGVPTIIGVSKAPCQGMRKGVISNLNGPFQAIDTALAKAESMSGYQVESATISINGSHILSTKADGMIVAGPADHEIDQDDIYRLQDVAISGKVPANREVLEIVPYGYKLDGQGDIKDPIGMTGTRLEINANVISALTPHVININKLADDANIEVNQIIPSVVAGARTVLTESQMENGVAVVDLGGATTSVAVYEEGDLQYVGVIPVGSVNITKDLAIGLKTDPEISEVVKIEHGTLTKPEDYEDGLTEVEVEGTKYSFKTGEIYDIIDARIEEIFEKINSELSKAGFAGKLPSGIIFVGGGANLKGLVKYAKKNLGLAAKIGSPRGFSGLAEEVASPEYSSAVGLMMSDIYTSNQNKILHKSEKVKDNSKDLRKKAGGIIGRISGMFKS